MNAGIRPPVVLALVAAVLIAALGFAAAQIFGEGAGMPLVAAVSTVWVAYFVRRGKRL